MSFSLISMSIYKYHYIIVGAGAAGLQLALAMNSDEYFRNKRILILDKIQKKGNDRTWSFWEKGKGQWDALVSKTWNKGLVKAKDKNIFLKLESYNYKMLRSADFYRHAKNQLKDSTIDWKTEAVEDIIQKAEYAEVITPKQNYEADFVFDSRIPMEYSLQHPDYLNIAQHFKGWIIETKTPVFDETRFTMMDYSLKDGDSTSFTYILPMSPNKALVEFTYFSPDLVSDTTYNHYLKKYISEQLQLNQYSIIETEQGVIPMTNFPFEDYHQKNIIKIGTAGGWVKASSGYSFKNCERESKHIIDFLKSNQKNYKKTTAWKYKHYDSIFLEVLSKENGYGEKLFYKMYVNNSIKTIFRFLDEKTSFYEDLKVILNLSSITFVKAFFRHIKTLI